MKKKVDVIKTILIYDKKGILLKEIEVSNMPWEWIYAKAIWTVQMTLMADHWDVKVKPKPKSE